MLVDKIGNYEECGFARFRFREFVFWYDFNSATLTSRKSRTNAIPRNLHPESVTHILRAGRPDRRWEMVPQEDSLPWGQRQWSS